MTGKSWLRIIRVIGYVFSIPLRVLQTLVFLAVLPVLVMEVETEEDANESWHMFKNMWTEPVDLSGGD